MLWNGAASFPVAAPFSVSKTTKFMSRERFLLTAGLIFIISGLAKTITFLGHEKILDVDDPIVGVPFRYLLLITGIGEIAVAYQCLFSGRAWLSVAMVAWAGTMFLAYRFGLLFLDWHRPCPCLGNLTDYLGISPPAADNIMMGALCYLLFGSYGILLHRWRKNRKAGLDRSRSEDQNSGRTAVAG